VKAESNINDSNSNDSNSNSSDSDKKHHAHHLSSNGMSQSQSQSQSKSPSFKRASASCLRFEDIAFTVKTKKGPKTILRDLSATVKSGDVLAVLGPSGAGKTTLMNVLTLQSFGGVATGTATLNDTPLSLNMFVKHCAVVTQQDFHWAFLTCREVLAYSLDLYGGVSAGDKVARIDEILSQLGLMSCADTKVGNEFMRGLSGGQKRRLSIGIALLKTPTVIFMDEPTSGLDAAAAASIMKFTKELAVSANVVTICTIHQPSAAVLAGFDQVMLLSQGRCAYRGLAADAEGYFEGIGFKMPAQMNPAEYMLEVVNSDFVDHEQVDRVLDAWATHERTSSSSSLVQSAGGWPALSTVESSGTGFFSQVGTLLRRHGTLTLRDPLLYTGRMVLMLVTCVFFAGIYIDSRDRNQAQVLYRMFLLNWTINVPTNFALVATYAQNQEYWAIRKEVSGVEWSEVR
jgi:ABC-type multidrug transport system ATPase subunit